MITHPNLQRYDKITARTQACNVGEFTTSISIQQMKLILNEGVMKLSLFSWIMRGMAIPSLTM